MKNCKHLHTILFGLYPATSMEWCADCGAIKKEAWRRWRKPKPKKVKK